MERDTGLYFQPFLDAKTTSAYYWNQDKLYAKDPDSMGYVQIPKCLKSFMSRIVVENKTVKIPKSTHYSSGYGFYAEEFSYSLPGREDISFSISALGTWLLAHVATIADVDMDVATRMDSNTPISHLTRLGEVTLVALKLLRLPPINCLSTRSFSLGLPRSVVEFIFENGATAVTGDYHHHRKDRDLIYESSTCVNCGAPRRNTINPNIITNTSTTAGTTAGSTTDDSKSRKKKRIHMAIEHARVVAEYIGDTYMWDSDKIKQIEEPYPHRKITKVSSLASFVPLDFIHIPLECVECKFTGELRYALNTRRIPHDKWLVLEFAPHNLRVKKDCLNEQIIKELQGAIERSEFWSRRVQFTATNIVDNPHDFMRRSTRVVYSFRVSRNSDGRFEGEHGETHSLETYGHSTCGMDLLNHLSDIFVIFKLCVRHYTDKSGSLQEHRFPSNVQVPSYWICDRMPGTTCPGHWNENFPSPPLSSSSTVPIPSPYLFVCRI